MVLSPRIERTTARKSRASGSFAMFSLQNVIEKVAGYLLAPFASPESLLTGLTGGISAFSDLKSKTGWLYIITSFLIAVVVFYVDRGGCQKHAASLRRFLFPPEVYLHRSAIVDYKYVAVDLTFKALAYSPLFAGVGMLSYKLFAWFYRVVVPKGFHPGDALLGTVYMPLIVFLATDFTFFFAHYLMHKVPVLWYFHEVHHSAEVLTPITVYRVHPVEELLGGPVGNLVLGGITALYSSSTGVTVELPTFLGINILSFAFFAFAFQLRHSHIWLSYGPVFSRIFISPAQHQIHHSRAPEHWHKNFGFMFAIWDGMFRTLYVPKGHETFRLGVPGADPEDFATVSRLYLR